jgi:hypothetical protein
MGERIAQPCALTTKVSHTSENSAAGSRLVTSIGTVTGNLELRRDGSTTFALCIGILFSEERAPVDPFTASTSVPLR